MNRDDDSLEADLLEGDTPTVRPYTVTGGRTRAGSDPLPIEALVRSLSTGLRLSGEKRTILELTDQRYLSIAELSARLRLPIGVVRVLVADLTEENLVSVHGDRLPASASASTLPLNILESVLNGIATL